MLTLINKIRLRLRARKAFRTTLIDLSRMSDRELLDIGIGRGMIYAIADQAYADKMAKG